MFVILPSPETVTPEMQAAIFIAALAGRLFILNDFARELPRSFGHIYTSLFASLWPFRRLSKHSVSDDLAVFDNFGYG